MSQPGNYGTLNQEGQTQNQQFPPIFDDRQGEEQSQVNKEVSTGDNNGRRMTILERMRIRRDGSGPSINLPPVPADTSLILNGHIMTNLSNNTFSGDELED